MQRIGDRIHFIETPDSFILEISNNISKTVRYFFLVMCIFVFIGLCIFIITSISLGNIFRGFVGITSGLLSILACFIWLNKTLKKEIIEVRKTTFSIQEKGLFGNNVKIYLISDIAYFKCAVKNAFTKNELHVGSFDYLGTQTGESQLQHVIKDGTLEFFCKGERIQFGLNILSWEGEEIIALIEKFTDNNLQLDDSMEKLLDDLKDVDNQEENLL